MHLERGCINKKPRTDEFFVLSVIAKNMAHVLAEKTLDAFTKFLYPIDVRLLHPPRAVLGVGFAGLEFLNAFLYIEIPRNIADKIFHRRESTHRFDSDRLGDIDRIEPRHAHQLWLAVDLSRARTALAGLAVPAAGEVRRRFGLDLMHCVEHDHSLGYLGLVIDHLTALAAASPYAECCFHLGTRTPSSAKRSYRGKKVFRALHSLRTRASAFPSSHFLDHLFQFRRHFGKRYMRDLHFPINLFHRDIELCKFRVLLGIVFTKLPAAAFLTFDR